MTQRLGTNASEAQRQAAERQQAAQAEAWAVSGFRVMYQIGVEERWFEGSEATPLESVLRSDYRDLIGNYCLKMSRL